MAMIKIGSSLVVASCAALLLTGCLAKAALDVVTLPVKVASKGVDLATTSQSEADQKRGRQMRQREERLGKLERDYAKLARKCERGDEDSCARAGRLRGEIDALLPTVPYEAR